MGRSASSPLTLVALIDLARTGDQAACTALGERLGPFLRHVIRPALRQPLRRLYDSMDVAQVALAAFFTKALFQCHFDTDPQVLAFLDKLAHYKLFKIRARHQCDKRRADRDPLALANEREAELIGRELDPLETALGSDLLRQLVETQTEVVRSIILMKWDGWKTRDIADALGWHVRRVRRVLQDALAKWHPVAP